MWTRSWIGVTGDRSDRLIDRRDQPTINFDFGTNRRETEQICGGFVAVPGNNREEE